MKASKKKRKSDEKHENMKLCALTFSIVLVALLAALLILIHVHI